MAKKELVIKGLQALEIIKTFQGIDTKRVLSEYNLIIEKELKEKQYLNNFLMALLENDEFDFTISYDTSERKWFVSFCIGSIDFNVYCDTKEELDYWKNIADATPYGKEDL